MPRPLSTSIDLHTTITRVVALDDHPLLLQGIRYQLERDERIELVAEGYTNADLLPLVEAHEPDVVLLDPLMPEAPGEKVFPCNGLRLLRTVKELHEQRPHIKVILLADVLDHNFLDEAIRAHIDGYLLKDDPLTKNLPNAIRHVQADGTVVSERVRTLRQAPRIEDLLTSREREVLLSLVRYPRCTPAERASHLELQPATLKAHQRNVYRKLDVNDAVAAVVVAMERGLVAYPLKDGGGGGGKYSRRRIARGDRGEGMRNAAYYLLRIAGRWLRRFRDSQRIKQYALSTIPPNSPPARRQTCTRCLDQAATGADSPRPRP